MSSRYRLQRPGQPLWFSVLTRIADTLASLSLAVILIFTLAGTLAFATFVEARYGTQSVQFFVYQTWWFDTLLILLAFNILFAAMVRYPWKRYQTGFVITHIGLLTLISGAALSRLYGIDSQVMVFEDQSSKWAWGDDHKITLREVSASPPTSARSGGKSDKDSTITFRGGPMNWSDYSTIFTFTAPHKDSKVNVWTRVGRSFVQGTSGLLFRLPFRHKAGDILFKEKDVEIKVLDYYADSAMEEPEPLRIQVGGAAFKRTVVNEEDGTSKQVDQPATWDAVPPLSVTAIADKTSFPLGFGGKQMVGGGFFTYTLAATEEQAKAFLESAPKLPLGERGVVVLGGHGKRWEFSVAEKLGKGRFPLEGTPFEVELGSYFPIGMPKAQPGKRIEFVGEETAPTPDNPLVTLKVFKEGKEVGRLALFSEAPEFNVHDYGSGIFGAYWFDQSVRPREERMQKQISSRIDIVQSPAHKLFYRYWNLKEVAASGELPTAGSEAEAINAFKMPFAQLKMYVERYVPCAGPEPIITPVKFSRETPSAQARPALELEITTKGANGEKSTEKRWLRAAFPEDPTRLQPDERMQIVSGGKKYELTMLLDVIDIGFRVKLDKFERKLDPGTSQAAHFSSTIDLLDRDQSSELRFIDANGVWPKQLKIADCDFGATLAVDSVRGDLFVPDAKRLVIWRIRNDGEMQISELTTQVGGEVTAIAVAPKSRKVYWVESTHQAGDCALMSISLDGDGIERVHRFTSTPKYMALNEAALKAYFIDPQSGDLFSLDLKDKKIKVLGGGFDEATGVVALDGGKSGPDIYVVSAKSGEILRVEDQESKSIARLSGDETPISLAVSPEGDALLVGVAIHTPRPANSNKPPAQRNPDAILRIDLKTKAVTPVATSRVYGPAAIAADPKSGRVYWVQSASLGENLWITMNAPIDVDDPKSGRSYRVFQESYMGPFRPGEPVFDANVLASTNKDELYRSVLSVNYDPGRGVRSAGCVLVIIGVAVMFFMRAYFFTAPNLSNSPLPNRPSFAPNLVTAEMVEA